MPSSQQTILRRMDVWRSRFGHQSNCQSLWWWISTVSQNARCRPQLWWINWESMGAVLLSTQLWRAVMSRTRRSSLSRVVRLMEKSLSTRTLSIKFLRTLSAIRWAKIKIVTVTLMITKSVYKHKLRADITRMTEIGGGLRRKMVLARIRAPSWPVRESKESIVCSLWEMYSQCPKLHSQSYWSSSLRCKAKFSLPFSQTSPLRSTSKKKWIWYPRSLSKRPK